MGERQLDHPSDSDAEASRQKGHLAAIGRTMTHPTPRLSPPRGRVHGAPAMGTLHLQSGASDARSGTTCASPPRSTRLFQEAKRVLNRWLRDDGGRGPIENRTPQRHVVDRQVEDNQQRAREGVGALCPRFACVIRTKGGRPGRAASHIGTSYGVVRSAAQADTSAQRLCCWGSITGSLAQRPEVRMDPKLARSARNRAKFGAAGAKCLWRKPSAGVPESSHTHSSRWHQILTKAMRAPILPTQSVRLDLGSPRQADVVGSLDPWHQTRENSLLGRAGQHRMGEIRATRRLLRSSLSTSLHLFQWDTDQHRCIVAS